MSVIKIQIYKNTTIQKILHCCVEQAPCRVLVAGQAALTFVLFFLIVTSAVIFGFSRIALSQAAQVRDLTSSKLSFAASESGVEDAAYRVRNYMIHGTQEELIIGNASVTTDLSSEENIIATAITGGAYRKSRVALVPGEGVGLVYALQTGSQGLEMNNNAKILDGTVASNGSIIGITEGLKPQIIGEAFLSSGIGNVPKEYWTDSPYNDYVVRYGNLQVSAQSFISPHTALPRSATVKIKKIGNPGNLNVRIYGNNDNGTPFTSADDYPDVNNLIAQANESNGIQSSEVLTTYSEVNTEFNIVNATLVKSKKYWLFVGGNCSGSCSTTNYYYLAGEIEWLDGQPDGSDGVFKYSTQAGGIWEEPQDNYEGDILYQVYMGDLAPPMINNIRIGKDRQNPIPNCATYEVHADTIQNTDIDINQTYLYCDNYPSNTFSCPSQTQCQNAYDNIPLFTPPFTDEQLLTDWIYPTKNTCGQGGATCKISGSYTVPAGTEAILSDPSGYYWIDGDLTVSGNDTTLTLDNIGLYINGNAIFDGGCFVKTTTQSAVIIVEGTVNISNNCDFSRSANGYILVISRYASAINSAITIEKNTTAGALYAINGTVTVKNNALLGAGYGEKISIQNDAIVQYETGLASTKFNVGPTAGYQIQDWQEIP